MGKYVYMKVSRDKYELPVAVADSAGELAEMVGVKLNSIYSLMSQAKKNGNRCQYVKVLVGKAGKE